MLEWDLEQGGGDGGDVVGFVRRDLVGIVGKEKV